MLLRTTNSPRSGGREVGPALALVNPLQVEAWSYTPKLTTRTWCCAWAACAGSFPRAAAPSIRGRSNWSRRGPWIRVNDNRAIKPNSWTRKFWLTCRSRGPASYCTTSTGCPRSDDNFYTGSVSKSVYEQEETSRYGSTWTFLQNLGVLISMNAAATA